MIKLAADTIDKEDINALCEWLQQETIPQLTKGPLTEQYEKEYAAKCGRKYAIFVNSGSSANLLSVYSLILSKQLKNNKVVVPAVSWITTLSPVIQFGLQPVLCDANFANLAVDVNKLEDIFIKEEPALLIVVSVLGMLPHMDQVCYLCDKYGVILMMDNCESQGSKYDGLNIESFGMLSTCSSYFGHITSTIEGGMITTDVPEMYQLLKSIRSHGWSREWEEWERNKQNYKWSVSDIESMYTFFYPSFNLRNNEVGAFLGLRQLGKLDSVVEKRNRNYNLFTDLIKNDYWKPEILPEKFVSNLGYPIISDKRSKIMAAMRENNVEVRPLVSGSMGRQPFWIERYGKKEMLNASTVHTAGLYLPNGPHISFKDIEFMSDIVNHYTCG